MGNSLTKGRTVIISYEGLVRDDYSPTLSTIELHVQVSSFDRSIIRRVSSSRLQV